VSLVEAVLQVPLTNQVDPAELYRVRQLCLSFLEIKTKTLNVFTLALKLNQTLDFYVNVQNKTSIDKISFSLTSRIQLK
jgi:hypothetical protein